VASLLSSWAYLFSPSGNSESCNTIERNLGIFLIVRIVGKEFLGAI
jgi:hypothetical protein